ncbi:MAG: hypothetical protein IT384_04540 [Deltaproteobacteria bacterium]|nr:hypothetical protein [Deltaproteobacteria bacterium]
MRTAIAQLLVLLAPLACADPELHVRFSVPEPYRSEMTSADIRVLEPPEVEPFGCEELAYGAVSADLARVSRVLEQSARVDEIAPLADVDRLQPKVIVVDGRAADGARLVTGCAELGAIDSTIDLDVIGEPVPKVSRPDEGSVSFTPDGPTGQRIHIDVRDRSDRPIAGVAAKWRIVGAGEAGSEGSPSSDANGQIAFDISSPGRAGPFLLVVRVRWAEGEPLVIAGAVTPVRETISLTGRAVEYVMGKIGPNNELGVAALTFTGLTPRVQLAFKTPAGFVFRSSEILPATVKTTLLEGKGRGPDRVLAVSPDEWIEIHPDGSTTRRPFIPYNAGASPVSMVAAELCDGSGPLVLVNFDDGVPAVYNELGQLVATHPLNGQLDLFAVASGCVGTQEAQPIRAVILAISGYLDLLIFAQNEVPTYRLGSWIALGTGIGFSRPTAGAKPIMLGTQLNLDDVIISRASFVLGQVGTPDQLRAVNLGHDPVPLAPQITAGGEVDGDGRLDVVSLLFASGGPSQPDRYQVWSILGLETSGRRIAGPLVPDVGLERPFLGLADFDGDQIDDVVLGERPGVTGPPDSRVQILPLGR